MRVLREKGDNMNRDIKFRAIPFNSSDFVYGCYLVFNDLHIISQKLDSPFPVLTKVKPETVSQFSGRTDKNGNEIYENDIIIFAGKVKYKIIFQKGCFACQREDGHSYHTLFDMPNSEIEISQEELHVVNQN